MIFFLLNGEVAGFPPQLQLCVGYLDFPRAAALWARGAKVPFDTLPPPARASADWIALARVLVIGVLFPLFAICFPFVRRTVYSGLLP
jgi:hypothetical protein